MKNASMVLGIIGGAIAIVYGLFLVLGGAVFMNTSMWENNYNTSKSMSDVVPESQYIQETTTAGIVFLSFGIGSAIAGALGLIGGIIVKKKNVASAVMMIIAGGLSFLAFYNVLSMILLILGGIFALMKEPQNVMQPYPSQYPQPSPSPENPPQK
jgi:Protein of unknown function (DUF4064)